MSWFGSLKSEMREMVGILMGPRAGLLRLMATTLAELSRARKLCPNLAAHVETRHPSCGKAVKSSFSGHDLEHSVAIIHWHRLQHHGAHMPLANPSAVSHGLGEDLFFLLFLL